MLIANHKDFLFQRKCTIHPCKESNLQGTVTKQVMSQLSTHLGMQKSIAYLVQEARTGTTTVFIRACAHLTSDHTLLCSSITDWGAAPQGYSNIQQQPVRIGPFVLSNSNWKKQKIYLSQPDSCIAQVNVYKLLLTSIYTVNPPIINR